MLATAEEAIFINDSISEDKDKAEYYLLNYKAELKNYEEAKEEYMNYQEEHDDNVGGGKSNMTGNPTERIALRGMEFDRKSESYCWLKAVEIVQRGLGERKNIFIKVRREAEERNNICVIGRGRKGWVVSVQHRYAEEMEKRFIIPEVWTSERSIKTWWQEIINKTIFVANKINNLKSEAL